MHRPLISKALFPFSFFALNLAKLAGATPFYPLAFLALITRRSFDRALNPLLVFLAIALSNVLLFKDTFSLFHTVAFALLPLLFCAMRSSLEKEQDKENFINSLLPIFIFSLGYFSFLRTFYSDQFLLQTQYKDFFKALPASSLIFSFYYLILINSQKEKSSFWQNLLGLYLFAVSGNKLLLGGFVFLLIIKKLRHFKVAKLMIVSMVLVAAGLMVIFFIGADQYPDLMFKAESFLNGRGYLYSVFPQNFGLLPKGLGFSSGKVVELLEKTSPAHEMTNYIHNIWMELFVDFGISAAAVFLFLGYLFFRKNLVLTTFICTIILSFGYSIYSPLIALLLAISIHFDESLFHLES